MIKIATVVGARPQFIKAAPVCRAVKRYNEAHGGALREVLIHTGQHYDYLMSKVFFDELGIPAPDYDLSTGSGSHGKQTGVMLEKIEEVLVKERPDAALVYGDTNTTLAGALAASKLHIPVAHVEAGLRSYNRAMPEEINRVVADHLSELLFCPTGASVRNLEKEGITKGVHQVGDVMYDSFLYNSRIARKGSGILADLAISPKGYYLSTIHRAENTDDAENLRGILLAFKDLDRPVILPLHPRTKKILAGKMHGFESSNICIIEPVPYLDMVMLTKNAAAVLTDSGGLQKEAYFLKVPCVTLREETEWTETVEAGWNVLAGADGARIGAAVKNIARHKEAPPYKELYGDGNAAERIIGVLSGYIH